MDPNMHDILAQQSQHDTFFSTKISFHRKNQDISTKTALTAVSSQQKECGFYLNRSTCYEWKNFCCTKKAREKERETSWKEEAWFLWGSKQLLPAIMVTWFFPLFQRQRRPNLASRALEKVKERKFNLKPCRLWLLLAKKSVENHSLFTTEQFYCFWDKILKVIWQWQMKIYPKLHSNMKVLVEKTGFALLNYMVAI